MKKSLLLSSFVLSFIVSTSLLAAESLEHFVTKDGRHYCSVFMKNDFQPCDTFGIRYEGDNVIEGEKPFFAAGFPNIEKVMIGDEVFCVEGSATDTGREVEMEKCSNISSATESPSENEAVLLEEVSGDLDQAPSDPSNEATISGEIDTNGGEAAPIARFNSGGLSPKCMVNGENVDCEKMMEGATSMVKKGLGILGIVLTVLFVLGIFSLWMLIHALSNPIAHKALWALCIFFFFPLGSIIYFFVVKRNFVKNAGVQVGNQEATQASSLSTGVPTPPPAPLFFPDPNPGVIGAYTPPVVPSPVSSPVMETPVYQSVVPTEAPAPAEAPAPVIPVEAQSVVQTPPTPPAPPTPTPPAPPTPTPPAPVIQPGLPPPIEVVQAPPSVSVSAVVTPVPEPMNTQGASMPPSVPTVPSESNSNPLIPPSVPPAQNPNQGPTV